MSEKGEDHGMDLNPFKTVSDYSKMLNKIGLFTFLFCLAAILFLRSRWPWLEKLLSMVPKDEVEVFSLKFHLGTVLPALGVGIVARAIKLHDRISDIFGIRKRFDIAEILLPLALGTASPIGVERIQRIAINRNSLMSKVFYKYASSNSEKSLIDRHLIEMALDQWCWYWILVEAAFVLLVSSLILGGVGHYRAASAASLSVLIIVAALVPLRQSCARYARNEVEAILSSVERRAEIAEVFNGL